MIIQSLVIRLITSTEIFSDFQNTLLSLTLISYLIWFQGKIDKRLEPFSVRQKQFWDVFETRTLLGPKFTKESLGHEPDGLIFQPKLDVSKSI